MLFNVIKNSILFLILVIFSIILFVDPVGGGAVSYCTDNGEGSSHQYVRYVRELLNDSGLKHFVSLAIGGTVLVKAMRNSTSPGVRPVIGIASLAAALFYEEGQTAAKLEEYDKKLNNEQTLTQLNLTYKQETSTLNTKLKIVKSICEKHSSNSNKGSESTTTQICDIVQSPNSPQEPTIFQSATQNMTINELVIDITECQDLSFIQDLWAKAEVGCAWISLILGTLFMILMRKRLFIFLLNQKWVRLPSFVLKLLKRVVESKTVNRFDGFYNVLFYITLLPFLRFINTTFNIFANIYKITNGPEIDFITTGLFINRLSFVVHFLLGIALFYYPLLSLVYTKLLKKEMPQGVKKPSYLIIGLLIVILNLLSNFTLYLLVSHPVTVIV